MLLRHKPHMWDQDALEKGTVLSCLQTKVGERCLTWIHAGTGRIGMWRVHGAFPKDKHGFWAEVITVPYGEGIGAGRERMKAFFASEEEAWGLGKGGCFAMSDSLPGEVVPTGARALSDRAEMGLSLETPQLLVALLFLPWGRTWPSFPLLFYYL